MLKKTDCFFFTQVLTLLLSLLNMQMNTDCEYHFVVKGKHKMQKKTISEKQNIFMWMQAPNS